MAINPDIRDHAYQFFIEEAPDLLQAIEAGLLTLKQERSTAKVHSLMRAAHSIKGGAASVELEAIALLAHRLEHIFKALYSETLELDTDLESQLLQAYDCLRLPLLDQIEEGDFDAEKALFASEPIFAQLEERLGDALTFAESYVPSSAELGVDMTQSIFEVDVALGLERLSAVVARPSDYEVARELRAQAEMFAGFAELLNLPEFGAIAKTTLAALDARPDRALEIAQLALSDFERSQQAVLAGNALGNSFSGAAGLTRTHGISPSAALVALASVAQPRNAPELTTIPTVEAIAEPLSVLQEDEDTIPLLEGIFGSAIATPETEGAGEDEFISDTSPALEARDTSDSPEILEVEWAAEATFAEEAAGELPSLEEIFSGAAALLEVETEAEPISDRDAPSPSSPLLVPEETSAKPPHPIPETLEATVRSIEQIFDTLPSIQDLPAPTVQSTSPPEIEEKVTAKTSAPASATLSVRVDSERLGRMNNLVGELAINRNSLSLQNEQLQDSVRELLNRFAQTQNRAIDLQKVSDRMLVTPQQHSQETLPHSTLELGKLAIDRADFDSLELDRYNVLHSQLQGFLEEMMQLEEAVEDIVLFAKATDRTIEQQRRMLGQLRDELVWASMLPLGEVLHRFPRILRDLSTTYNKPVNLKLSGTSVLVDKAVLEKLYDPLLHLLRNAFDHGIEPPEVRRQNGKPEQGHIEIRAYHQGSQTIIEVRDDGQGLNLERIGCRVLEMGLLRAEQLATIPPNRLQEFIFEPGFSTKSEVSELSGRGVGLDVVRSQLRSLKGTITVTSQLGAGTTFTLRLPLTLTIAKLLVCFSGSTALAIPSDSIEEIIIPKADQIKQSGTQRFLHWRGQIVPAYRLADLLDYNCPLPEMSLEEALGAVPSPKHWALPMLILGREQHFFALEIDRLVTEQELVIKPFGAALAPPSCTYGCTILGDGSLIPVIDGIAVLEQLLGQSTATTASEGQASTSESHQATVDENSSVSQTRSAIKTRRANTVLIVDDAVSLRRTLALTLERAGYRVVQAGDGREAIEQFQENPLVQLVICDIEMPNMNGFEFLSVRRQEPQLSKIPVIMLTSRSNEKHRWLAMQLGATAYFTKPYLEREFLVAISTILAQNSQEIGDLGNS